MAGEWFPVDVALDTKPEVQELVDLTGEAVEVVVFRLLKLWGWAQLNTADGSFRATPARLGRICGGDDAFWLAVAQVGWIEFDGETANIPKWESRFSGAAKSRTLKNRRQSRYRAAPVDAGVALVSRSRGAQAPPKRLPEERTIQDRTEEKETHTPRGREADDEFRKPGWAAAEWDAFLPLWNACKRAARWDGLGPPAGWVDAAASPGWLQNARKAVERLGRCHFFDNPLAITQFIEPGWVDRINAGEFDNAKRGRAKPERGGDFGGAPPPPKTWSGADEAARRAMLERTRKLKEEVSQ